MSAVEWHRADPKLKRTALLGIGTTVVLGSVALWLLQRWLDQASKAAFGLDIIVMGFVGVGVMVSGGLLILGWSLWQESITVKREQRYPPTNMRTLRDVPVVHGDLAQAAARRLHWAALGLLAFAMVLAGWLWSTLRHVLA